MLLLAEDVNIDFGRIVLGAGNDFTDPLDGLLWCRVFPLSLT